MLILVEDMDNNEIFKGEADDFLFSNDNDYDLEDILDRLECEDFGTSIEVNNGEDEYTITKIDELLY